MIHSISLRILPEHAISMLSINRLFWKSYITQKLKTNESFPKQQDILIFRYEAIRSKFPRFHPYKFH